MRKGSYIIFNFFVFENFYNENKLARLHDMLEIALESEEIMRANSDSFL